MSELIDEFLAREKDGLAGLEDDIPTAFNTQNSELDNDSGSAGANSGSGVNDTNDDFFYKGQPPSADVPEKIRKWREEQISRLETKDAQEVQTKELLRQHAEKELADWYKRHEDTIAKTKSLNRNAEKENIADINDEIEPGTEWERIAKLCDFSQSTKSIKSLKDNGRMRSIILQLKQSPIDREKA